jgi:hypothetical protein
MVAVEMPATAACRCASPAPRLKRYRYSVTTAQTARHTPMETQMVEFAAPLARLPDLWDSIPASHRLSIDLVGTRRSRAAELLRSDGESRRADRVTPESRVGGSRRHESEPNKAPEQLPQIGSSRK